MAVDTAELREVDDPAVAEAPPAAAALSLRGIRHRYAKTAAPVLAGVDLDVEAAEVVALLGPSGCGKTTLLRIVAGLITPTHGDVVMAGTDVTRVATHKRNIGLVHQNFALWPHMTVAENVAFGLDMRHHDRNRRMRRVDEVLELVGLAGFAHRLPRQLSGGQQQRVALARALAFEPNVLLLDEPLSSLDANLRHQLQSHLRQLQRTTGVTTVIVTHDREEAMGVSSRIVVLDRGRVQQVAAAPDLYRAPATAFVMRFTGECNLVHGVVTGDGRVDIPAFGRVVTAPAGCPVGSVAQVGFRPEHVSVTVAGAGLPAVVVDAAFLGPVVTYELRVGDRADAPVIVARHDTATGGEVLRPGDHVSISIPSPAFHAFPLEDPDDHPPTPSPHPRRRELAGTAPRRLWRRRQ